MALLGSHDHPDVTMDCIAMGRSMAAYESGDYGTIRGILSRSLDRLGRAGADFFVCPDNTAHLALEHAGPELPLPGLHIAETVAQRAAEAGHQTVGVLGTKWTMESKLYPRALEPYGLQTRIPDAEDRDAVQAITFNELVHGVFNEASRELFINVIAKLGDAGCDAVALVCTEFPLLITPTDSPLPTLGSTVLLAQAAADVATGAVPPPNWRGGPFPGEPTR